MVAALPGVGVRCRLLLRGVGHTMALTRRGAGSRARRVGCRWQSRVQRRAVRRVLRRAVRRCARIRNRPGRRPARRGGCWVARAPPRVTGKVVGLAGEADAGVGPDVHSGAPAGVGDQLTHRPVLRDVGQRSAARLAARAALGRRRSADCPGTCRGRRRAAGRRP